MTKTLAALSALLLAGVTSGAAAHSLPAAGAAFSAGLAHPFLGPDHVLAMVAIGIYAARLGKQSVLLVIACVGAALVAGAFLASAIAAPVVEPLIAISVGAAVLLAGRAHKVGPPYGVALASLFALLHGAVHAAAQPAPFSTVAYVAGVVLASTILQLLGAAMACAAARQAAVRRAVRV